MVREAAKKLRTSVQLDREHLEVREFSTAFISWADMIGRTFLLMNSIRSSNDRRAEDFSR
ncbi:hypothetical protein D3C80_2111520 [compost metagenome]